MSNTFENITGADREADLSRAGDGEAGFALFDFYVAQLEAYLDGELSGAEALAVRQRLIQEEAYAAALGRLHAQRAQRAEAFAQIERGEVDEASAARVVARARKIVTRARLEPSAGPGLSVAAAGGRAWPTWAKVVGGMAACVLVGFGVGLIGSYDFGGEPVRAGQPTPYGEAGSDGTGRWVYLNADNQPQVAIPAENRPMPNPARPQPSELVPSPPR